MTLTDDEMREAKAAMRAAPTRDALVDVWWNLCERSKGAQREDLQDVYADELARFTPMMRAG